MIAAIGLLGFPAQAQPGAAPPYQPADPGYGPPPPPPPNPDYSPPPPQYRPPPRYVPPRMINPRRRGFTIGFGFGLGAMDSANDLFRCAGCGKGDGIAAGSVDFHIGGMLTPRLALLLEVWGTGGVLDNAGDVLLSQMMAMGAAQYWVSPKLWIKGGIGAAELRIDRDASTYSEDLDNGLGIMAAVGYELLARRGFVMDFQFRVGAGFYDDLGADGDEVSAASFGLGFNWY